jgi:hypothetical protein
MRQTIVRCGSVRETDRPIDKRTARQKKAKKFQHFFQNTYPPIDFKIVLPRGLAAPSGVVTQKFSIFDKKKKCQTS